MGLSIPWRRNDSLRDVSYFSGKNIVFLVGRYQQQSTTGRVDLQLMSVIASTIPATFFLIYYSIQVNALVASISGTVHTYPDIF